MGSCTELAKAMVYDKTFRILIKDTNRKMQKENVPIGCMQNELVCFRCDADSLM